MKSKGAILSDSALKFGCLLWGFTSPLRLTRSRVSPVFQALDTRSGQQMPNQVVGSICRHDATRRHGSDMGCSVGTVNTSLTAA